MKIPRLFTPLAVGLVAVCCLAVLAVNGLVDPLWYFSGNRISHKNQFFNEREAKANLYYKNRFNYDCILLGASSATTLDLAAFPGHKCFNFAFSGALLQELTAYAHYVKSVGRPPKLVIVSVDLFNLLVDGTPPDIPQYVQNASAPTPFWEPYLSLAVTEHSLGELLEPDYARIRYYTLPDELAQVAPNHPAYMPPAAVRAAGDRVIRRPLTIVTELRRLFPRARIIGYSPFTSAWRVSQLLASGQLDDCSRARHALARSFDAFYDFSVPSLVTQGTADTYDGFHYTPSVNRAIALALAGATPDALQPAKMSEDEYVAFYRGKTLDFIHRRNVVLRH